MKNEVSLKDQLYEWSENKVVLGYDGAINGFCWNFYDWFCSDKSLERRSKALFPKIKKFINVFDVDPTEVYVFFKNNCPVNGGLYDDFRICSRDDGKVLYTATPYRVGDRNKDHWAEIWSRENDFDGPLHKGTNLSEIYRQISLHEK